jgi:iron(III) transport system permease protein
MSRALGVLWVLPLAAFGVEAALGAGGFDVPRGAWGNTLALAGTASLFSVVVGVPVGATLAGSRAAAAALAPLLVPPVVSAAGWMALRLPSPGAAGCGAILACSLWPVVAFPVAAALSRLPASELEAARLQLGPGRIVSGVLWPAVRPGLLGGALLAAVLAVSDFTVPAVFVVPTLSTVVFERLSAFEFRSAAAAALPLVALAGVAAWALARVPVVPRAGSGVSLGGRAPALVLALAMAFLPGAVCVRALLSPAEVFGAVALYGSSMGWSVLSAALAALVLVGWSAWARGRSLLEPVWLAALVLPGVVTALGVLLLAGAGPAWLGNSGLLLGFALAARAAYVAWRPLRDAVEPSQLEAAALAGWSRFRAWRRVVLPALRPRILAAAAVVFALALGEIGASVLLAPPGRSSAVQHLFNLMHYGYDGTVAALALALAAGPAAAAWIGAYAGKLGRA